MLISHIFEEFEINELNSRPSALQSEALTTPTDQLINPTNINGLLNILTNYFSNNFYVPIPPSSSHRLLFLPLPTHSRSLSLSLLQSPPSHLKSWQRTCKFCRSTVSVELPCSDRRTP